MTSNSDILKRLSKVYGNDSEELDFHLERFRNLEKRFIETFNSSPKHIFSTPGRSEISGNHTDHNNGKVLAASVSLDTICLASKNNDNRIRVVSDVYDEIFDIDLKDLAFVESEKESTNSLIRGIASKFHELGKTIGGFNAVISSLVKPGSGLSSSASFEITIAKVLSTLFNNDSLSPLELSKIGQFAENNFFGKPCGLMDQMACAYGGLIYIDFESPTNPIVEAIKIDHNLFGYNLVIIETGSSHHNLTEDYASIPSEMKSIAAFLGKDVLRNIDYDEFIKAIPTLRLSIGDRAVLRTLHFFDENIRVEKQNHFLKTKDYDKFLTIVNESGNSSFKYLQNIYSNNDINSQGISMALALTEKFIAKIDKGACRVHGGGFAGTIQAFIPKEFTFEYKAYIESFFNQDCASVLNIRNVGTIEI